MNKVKAIRASVAFLAILMILIPNFSVAQTSSQLKVDNQNSVNVLPADVVWQKTYGGAADDRAFYALPTSDGYLVVGSSASIVANTSVGWALKLNPCGNVVWNKTFLEGFGTELRYAINLTDGFLLVGNEFFASGDINGYVAKIDNQGTVIWNTVLGAEEIDKLFSGISTPDGYAVFGLTASYGNNQSVAFVVKLDEEGNVVWNKTYEQTETTLREGALGEDGNYTIAGYTNTLSDGNFDFCLLKIQPNGSLVWSKTYGGEQSEKAYSMTKSADGYLLVGEVESLTSSTDAWVVKVDNNSNMLWNKTVGGKQTDSPAYITQTEDGGYIVAGFTFSYGAGQRDFWLFKISDQGQVQFSCTQGNEAFQEAYSVIETGNNTYVMVGWTDPVGRPDLIGKKTYDFYVAEFSVAKENNLPSSNLVITFSVTALIVVLASLILKFKPLKKE